MRVSPAVDQQCAYAPSTPNPLARAHSVQRPGVAVTRRLNASTYKMLHPNPPALIPGSIPPTCTKCFPGACCRTHVSSAGDAVDERREGEGAGGIGIVEAEC
jgi:hypothetical protein